MPTSDSGDSRRAAAAAQQQAAAAAPPLACPRCDSANTKFCYYNNYNLAQPRHFCKACRRYWTHGGTLRDVPVGGGSRKNSKRSRSSSSAATSSASSSSESPIFSPSKPGHSDPTPEKPEPFPDEELGSGGGGALGFTSLLNSQSPGFLALGGYGYGLDEMGFGFGARPGVWPFVDQVGGADLGGSGGGGGGGSGVECNTWQMSGGSEGGLVDSVDCFAWPDLSISMPGNGLK